MTEVRVSIARFRRLWADKSLTRDEVAAQLGVNRSTVTEIAQRAGLPKRWFKASDEEVRAAWLDLSISVPEACARLGMTRGALWHRVSNLGLPPRSRRRRDARVSDWGLFDDMVRSAVMLHEIASFFDRTPLAIGRMARRRGLLPRPEGAVTGLKLAEYAEMRLGNAMAERVAAERRALADQRKAAASCDRASQERVAA